MRVGGCRGLPMGQGGAWLFFASPAVTLLLLSKVPDTQAFYTVVSSAECWGPSGNAPRPLGDCLPTSPTPLCTAGLHMQGSELHSVRPLGPTKVTDMR